MTGQPSCKNAVGTVGGSGLKQWMDQRWSCWKLQPTMWFLALPNQTLKPSLWVAQVEIIKVRWVEGKKGGSTPVQRASSAALALHLGLAAAVGSLCLRKSENHMQLM